MILQMCPNHYVHYTAIASLAFKESNACTILQLHLVIDGTIVPPT